MDFIQSLIPVAQAHSGSDHFGHHAFAGSWAVAGLVITALIAIGIAVFIKLLVDQKNKDI